MRHYGREWMTGSGRSLLCRMPLIMPMPRDAVPEVGKQPNTPIKRMQHFVIATSMRKGGRSWAQPAAMVAIRLHNCQLVPEEEIFYGQQAHTLNGY